jgi:hypothetical protein
MAERQEAEDVSKRIWNGSGRCGSSAAEYARDHLSTETAACWFADERTIPFQPIKTNTDYPPPSFPGLASKLLWAANRMKHITIYEPPSSHRSRNPRPAHRTANVRGYAGAYQKAPKANTEGKVELLHDTACETKDSERKNDERSLTFLCC